MMFRIIHFCLNQPMLGCVGEPHDDHKHCLSMWSRRLQWLRQSWLLHTYELRGSIKKTARQAKPKQMSAALYFTHLRAESVAIVWKNRFATHVLVFQPLHKAFKKPLKSLGLFVCQSKNHQTSELLRHSPATFHIEWWQYILSYRYSPDFVPMRFFKTITFGTCKTSPLIVARPL